VIIVLLHEQQGDQMAKEKKKGKDKKIKRKLTEHTSFKNINKKKTKKRQAIWVKKFHLEYKEELNRLQTV
jgi:hypothetical protein